MRGARAVLNAYRDRLAEQKAEAAHARQATAALPAQIRAMLADTDRTTLAGKRNAAVVLLGFATAARGSELAALDIASAQTAEHGYESIRLREVRRILQDEVETVVGDRPGVGDSAAVEPGDS